MKTTTKRFYDAFTKLHDAFHGGTLNAASCTACAVGNICDNESDWTAYLGHLLQVRAPIFDNRITGITEREEYSNNSSYEKNGYDKEQLHQIEKVFLTAMIGMNFKNKEAQYIGLRAVVEYIASLDRVDAQDYTKYLEIDEHGNPVNKLSNLCRTLKTVKAMQALQMSM